MNFKTLFSIALLAGSTLAVSAFTIQNLMPRLGTSSEPSIEIDLQLLEENYRKTSIGAGETKNFNLKYSPQQSNKQYAGLIIDYDEYSYNVELTKYVKEGLQRLIIHLNARFSDERPDVGDQLLLDTGKLRKEITGLKVDHDPAHEGRLKITPVVASTRSRL